MLESANNVKNDTIVVAARQEGFEKEFMTNHCWYQVPIRSDLLKKIRYIAIYRSQPISAITHIAEVESIEVFCITKYLKQKKYIIYIKDGSIKEIEPIILDKSFVPYQKQVIFSPRYTNIQHLLTSKTLIDLWNLEKKK